MKNETKKVETYIDLSKLNLNEFIKHLDSQGVVYKKFGFYLSKNVGTVILSDYDYKDLDISKLNYFCMCGTRITPDDSRFELIIKEILDELIASNEYIEFLIADSVKNTDEK